MNKFFGHMIIPTGLILIFPLLGVLIDGQSVLPYLVFPPKPVVTCHGAFSLPVFMAFMLLILTATLPFLKVWPRPHRQKICGCCWTVSLVGRCFLFRPCLFLDNGLDPV